MTVLTCNYAELSLFHVRMEEALDSRCMPISGNDIQDMLTFDKSIDIRLIPSCIFS